MLAELELEALDLPETSMDILKLLKAHGEMDAETVQNRLMVARKQKFTRAIEHLWRNGFIGRRQSGHTSYLRLKEAL